MFEGWEWLLVIAGGLFVVVFVLFLLKQRTDTSQDYADEQYSMQSQPQSSVVSNKFCSRCGYQMASDAKFCSNCGNRLS